MRQQINLYQDCLRDKKPPLGAALMLEIVIACVLILTLGVVLLNRQNLRLTAELQEAQREQVQSAAELGVLKARNPARQNDPQLKQTLLRKQAELAARKPLVAYLEHFKPGKTTGFSPLIEGLARYPLEGVWLTGIRLNNDKEQVLLAGSAVRPDLVPAYLQHLGDKKVLKEQTFSSLKLTRVNEQNPQVDFRLESGFEAADE